MHRSGLALAGAQTTLEAWARGEVPPTENDDIVTAEEVGGGIKLDRTSFFVCLSHWLGRSARGRRGEGIKPWLYLGWSAEPSYLIDRYKRCLDWYAKWITAKAAR